MIPKTIHYCWFGGNPLPNDTKKYIETWRKYCPDYELVEWNESNFDIHSNKYVEQAYESKKWAFVSDYVRLYAIYYHGGVYMDTDVEVTQSLDEFLEYRGFTGFETPRNPLTGTMACEKGNELIGEVLEGYSHREFINPDGSFDMTTNIIPFREICLRHGFEMNNCYQKVDGFAIFPNDYFCAYNFRKRQHFKTENTHTIHHFAGSWIPKRQRYKRIIRKIIGNRVSDFISSVFKK